jgi:hypothetical protein
VARLARKVEQMAQTDEQLTVDEQQEWLFLTSAWWRSWLSNALALRKAAHVLWNLYQTELDRFRKRCDPTIPQEFDLGHEGIAMMLMGMALENLLKAKLLIRDPSLVGKRSISRKLKTHNLTKLFAETGYVLKDAQEIQYVEDLSRFVEWQGRYPGPVDAKDIGPLFHLEGNWQSFTDLFERSFPRLTPEQIAESDEAFSQRLNQFWDEIEQSRHS